MKIMANVLLGGIKDTIKRQALVDTGAEVSLMPRGTAIQIGAWRTDQYKNIVGVHREVRTLPVIAAYLAFPSLTKKVCKFSFVMSDEQDEIIVGMDILQPAGITIDSRTGLLTVKNETWEAFKTISGKGLLIYGGIKILGAIFSDKPKSRKRRRKNG